MSNEQEKNLLDERIFEATEEEVVEQVADDDILNMPIDWEYLPEMTKVIIGHIIHPLLSKEWEKLKLPASDLEDIGEKLEKNQDAGDGPIQGTKGARKLDTHHRGATRIIYAYIHSQQKIGLVFCYLKSKQPDLTPKQKGWVNARITQMENKEVV